MKNELTQEQIDFYQENGYIIIEDFLSPAELETWRQRVDDAVARRGNRKLADRSEVDDESEEGKYRRLRFVQRLNLWTDHAGMRELMLDPRLGKMASELAGVDGMRIWHDQALNKQPWANPTGWHLDNPLWSYSSRDALSIWVALDDATLQNGCLYFLPGAHKTATFDTSNIGPNISDLFDHLSTVGGIGARRGADEGRVLLLPQRSDAAWSGREYDAGLAAGDDLRLYARWLYL